MRIRFVGGPRHNRILEVGPKPNDVWHVVVQDSHTIEDLSLEPGCGPLWRRESYHLHRFSTPSGTKYQQYVHESLIGPNGRPHPSAYKEKFKKWKKPFTVT